MRRLMGQRQSVTLYNQTNKEVFGSVTLYGKETLTTGFCMAPAPAAPAPRPFPQQGKHVFTCQTGNAHLLFVDVQQFGSKATILLPVSGRKMVVRLEKDELAIRLVDPKSHTLELDPKGSAYKFEPKLGKVSDLPPTVAGTKLICVEIQFCVLALWIAFGEAERANFVNNLQYEKDSSQLIPDWSTVHFSLPRRYREAISSLVAVAVKNRAKDKLMEAVNKSSGNFRPDQLEASALEQLAISVLKNRTAEQRRACRDVDSPAHAHFQERIELWRDVVGYLRKWQEWKKKNPIFEAQFDFKA